MFKILLFSALGVVWLLFIAAAYSGRRTAQGHVVRLVPRHRRKGQRLFYTVAGLIIIIEVLVRGRGGASVYDTLLWVHICLSVLFFSCITLMNFWFNGRRSSLHRWFAYSSLVLLIGVTVTAIPIILRLPV